jgi:membrane protease subunit HflC
MNKNKGIIFAIIIIVGIVVVKNSVYVLNPGQQAIITQFGKPIGEPKTKAGFGYKTPFVQKVRYVDKRILNWDGIPKQVTTKDKKFIKVDTTARWRITNALTFLQTVQGERGAQFKIGAILDSATKNVISRHNLVEAVRNSNLIESKIKEKRKEIAAKRAKGETFIEDDLSGDVEKIRVGRENLSLLIAKDASKGLKKFGIELIDVQLKRISYDKSVEKKVYERMISERKKIAEKIRSIGQGEKAKIEGRLMKDLQKIESEAYRKAQEIRGYAEAKSIAIYASALKNGENFYEFTRSMEAYKRTFSNRSKFLLSSDSKFLKYLKNGSDLE